MVEHYQRPGWFTKHLFNPTVEALTRAGVSVAGSHVLEVRGRRSGRWHSTPVNPLSVNGERYLLAPRGNTQWVKNLRSSGEGRLRRGRHRERFTAAEVTDEQKVVLLRAYLKRWSWEVGSFFDGVGPDSSEQELRRIAPDHPAFRIDAPRRATTPEHGADPARGSMSDPASGSRPDPAPGSRPDPAPGSRPDPAPGSRPDPASGS